MQSQAATATLKKVAALAKRSYKQPAVLHSLIAHLADAVPPASADKIDTASLDDWSLLLLAAASPSVTPPPALHSKATAFLTHCSVGTTEMPLPESFKLALLGYYFLARPLSFMRPPLLPVFCSAAVRCRAASPRLWGGVVTGLALRLLCRAVLGELFGERGRTGGVGAAAEFFARCGAAGWAAAEAVVALPLLLEVRDEGAVGKALRKAAVGLFEGRGVEKAGGEAGEEGSGFDLLRFKFLEAAYVYARLGRDREEIKRVLPESSEFVAALRAFASDMDADGEGGEGLFEGDGCRDLLIEDWAVLDAVEKGWRGAKDRGEFVKRLRQCLDRLSADR